ncbi:MAG: hypothetical protein MUF23_07470 [Pirellula sp.]|nr:hypothetical protein [Pirellula sp.]
MHRIRQCVLSILALAPLWMSHVPRTDAQVVRSLTSTPTGKFHTPSVPPAAGQDPWGPARALGIAGNASYPIPDDLLHVDMYRQSQGAASAKSQSCIHCHTDVGNMHPPNTVQIGCVDCHGGNANDFTKQGAHVAPRYPNVWTSSANPVRSYTALNHESPEFIRFMNPGDLRVAHIACGQCHANEVLQLRKSMMTHGCMLWGAALYNNGAVPQKWARYGESYSMFGQPQRLQNVPAPTPYEMDRKGMVPFLDPLPRFESSQPANILRIFERGGRFRPEVGIPERLEEPGRPRERLSTRGLGTDNRTDPVFIGLQKTRLLDPTLNFLGTNDHPGDYRSSGCSACHVLYANDRSPTASGPFAKYGHMGQAASQKDDWVQYVDPTIPNHESGHPIQHVFTNRMPTSQCMVCHMHPGTNVLNSYLGYMWWDNETDGQCMYPKVQKNPTAEELIQTSMSNPEEAAARGLWGDPEFLNRVSELNPQLQHTQFADFHGHGWVFRAVFKKDRTGNLLDHQGDALVNVATPDLMAAVAPSDPHEKIHGKQRDGVPVHMMDIHMEKGMHCVDCHFYQDGHGDTKLYGEVRAAIEIQCIDCHGDASLSLVDKVEQQLQSRQPPKLTTSGPASGEQPTNLLALRTAFGQPRFEIRRVPGKKPQLIQRSNVEKDLEWVVTQTADTLDPQSEDYNARSHAAKTVRMDPDGKMRWGGKPTDGKCAHNTQNMNCIACHSSWNPSCFGCHLPQKANIKAPSLHNDGQISRNRVSYNFQTLRDDVFMLARDGNVTGNRIGPARSSCAIHVGSYNANRESIYIQQQTISGEGLSGIAFSTNVPHTVRGGNGWSPEQDSRAPGTFETKSCTDCHVSINDDNNAIMAQLLMQGTGATNFIGRYCWVGAGEHGLEGIVVTEQHEPQAVIGSTLHSLAYPDNYKEHVEHGRILEHAHEHPGRDILETLSPRYRKPEILSLQHRGEFLYAACGEGGLRVFDIAFIDHKGFSERITTAPVSPLGQRLYVRTEYATSVAAPTTIAPDPTRTHRPENFEPAIPGLYAYIYVTDKYEGLILVSAATLLDGDPTNNFLEREVTFNPNGLLCGATTVSIAGNYAYVCCDAGLVVVDLTNPKTPSVVSVVGNDVLHHPKSVAIQFRYAFVCDEEGVKVFDVTELGYPQFVHEIPLEHAHNIYLARTYAYVAAGPLGLVILDITSPASAYIDQIYDAGGQINDAHDVKLGITNVSQFAYIADGKNGLRVVQLTSPEVHGNDGFSPRPQPCLIATRKLPKDGHALSVSRGVDRDRAVDESGNQIAVFGRVGARPLNREEVQRMHRRPDGSLFQVSDNPFDLRVYDFPETILRLEQAKQPARRTLR